MEDAPLSTLKTNNSFLHEYNLLNLILKYPFKELVGNTLLRLYARQFVDGLEILNRNNFMNFIIKPENILVTKNLELKLSIFTDMNKLKKNLKMI